MSAKARYSKDQYLLRKMPPIGELSRTDKPEKLQILIKLESRSRAITIRFKTEKHEALVIIH